MAANETDLKLKVTATDDATATLKKVNAQIAKLAAPAKLKEAQARLSSMLAPSRFAPMREAASKLGGTVGGVVSGVVGLATKLGFAAAAGTVAFGAIIHGAMEAGDKLGEVSQRVGMTADGFASLQFSAGQSDIDPEAFAAGMDKLNKSLGDAKAGGGQLLGFLNKVSPALAEQFKHAKSSEEALSLMGTALERVKDPARRAALASAAFGKQNAQFGVWLSQGSAAIQEQQREAMKLHGSWMLLASGGGDLDGELKKSTLAFEGMRDAVAVALFPALTALAAKVTEFVAANRDGLTKWAERAASALTAWVSSGGFERLVGFLGSVASAASTVISAFAEWAPILAPLLTGPLLVWLGGLAAAGWANAAAWLAATAPLLPFVAAASAVALAGKAVYDNWGDIKLLFKDLGWWIQDTMNGAWEKVKGFIDLLGKVTGLSKFTDLAKSFGDVAVKNQLSLVGPMTGAVPLAPSLGAPVSLPPAMSSSMQSTEANVNVSFSNMPKGTRVTTDPTSNANMSINTGYSQVTQ